MRFLLEFVPCCGSQRPRRAIPETAGSAPRAEETGSLMKLPPGGARMNRRRKRGRVDGRGASGFVAAPTEWKPTLSVISEDNAVMMLMEKKSGHDVGSSDERAVKRKSCGDGSRSRVHGRNYNDDFGRNSFTRIMPAFSPTPFMF